MALKLKLFEYQEQFMIDTFLIQITNFEKVNQLVLFLFRW